MRPFHLVVACLSVAVAALAGGCAPLQSDPDPALSAEAQRVWREVGGAPGFDVKAVTCVGTPAAMCTGIGPRPTVLMFVPVGSPPLVATALMRYELSKIAFVQGDGSLLSQLWTPIRWLDAVTHGPMSEALSVKAMLLPAEVKPFGRPRDSVFENSTWAASVRPAQRKPADAVSAPPAKADEVDPLTSLAGQ